MNENNKQNSRISTENTEDKVLVLDMKGQPMEGTVRFGKVRKMLKDGRAKIVQRYPFTIQLTYEPENKKAFEEKKAAEKKAKSSHKTKNSTKFGNSTKSNGSRNTGYQRSNSGNASYGKKTVKNQESVQKGSARNSGNGSVTKPATGARNSVYTNGRMKTVPQKTTKTIKTKSGKTIIINSYK